MRTTVGGRTRNGRIGVVRILLFVLAFLAVAVAGVALFLRYSGDTYHSGIDIRDFLRRVDSVLPERERAAEAWALADRASSFVARKGLGVESELAVLKRRRSIARSSPAEYAGLYFEAALTSAERFPHAGAISAVVVDAALPLRETKALAALRSHSPRLDAVLFGALKALALARLGDTASPSSAVPLDAILAAADAYSAALPEAASLLAVDAVIVSLLSGNALEARAVAQGRLSDPDGLSPSALRFLAEFVYDFGDPNESAALFSRLPAGYSLRRADAAHLAGDTRTAREAWFQAAAGPAARLALYNLASTSLDPAEAFSYARRLHSLSADFAPGVILYARLAGEHIGLQTLSTASELGSDVLIDLELVRLGAPRVGLDRSLALLWLLMNEDPRSKPLARWAAWYAASNGRIGEALRFVQVHRNEGLAAPWIDFYSGIEAALSGDLGEAEKAFERAAAESGDWRLAADTGVLYESLRNPREALRRYEIAASLGPAGADAAEIQLRIARLLVNLGRRADARRVLEYALDRDPGNRRARTELKRLDGR